ncbi:MAG: alpha/beta hydrolase [Alphaproteobacteria bacterium]|nr:alpha/beta hydrolase [Alphaproteobacteria bacterium]
MVETSVFFATNRRPNDPTNPTDFTEEFVGDIDSIRFGSATVPGDTLYEQDADALGARITLRVEPEKLDPTHAGLSQLGSTASFTAIGKAMREGNSDALFFIHGYNYRFRASLARAAQLQQWLSTQARPLTVLFFAWPSLGEGVAPQTYKDERKRAEASGSAIARAVLTAADFIRATPRADRCLQRIHLISHSMGAWALRGAIQQMRTFVGDNIPPLFAEVMVLAGDEDDDALSDRRKLLPILRGSQRITVYYNLADYALKASDVAMGNPDRRGRSGPENRAALPEKVVPVNVSPAIRWEQTPGFAPWEVDETGHQYYRNNRLVRDDLVEVLKGTPTADTPGRAKRDDYWRLG